MISRRVAELDLGLFSHIESQTSDADRRSLLALHNALAQRERAFTYLEIGSHLGGSLQAVLADPRCTKVVSIDPRPDWQPDDRPGLPRFDYPENSTGRMLELLATVPDADLGKLVTVEGSTENLAPTDLERPDLCFIDGEHTRAAALRDARFCRAVLRGRGVIAFHDFQIVEPAVVDFMRECARPRRGFLLAHAVFVVELGPAPSLLADAQLRRQLTRLGRILPRTSRLDSVALRAHLRWLQR